MTSQVKNLTPQDAGKATPPQGIAQRRALTPSVDQLSLDLILQSAPIGLEIVSARGETIYANNVLTTERVNDPALKDGAQMRTRRFEIATPQGECSLFLSFDDTERMLAEQDLIQRAYFDELTGLPNRTLIERSINALITEDAAPFSVAFIDLDGFKHVNDYYGHDVGDQLLAKIAERLSANLRPSDMAARLSGDEFVLMLSPCGDSEQLRAEMDRVCARIKEPFFVDGQEIFTSASIGVSIYPNDGRSYEVLRSTADRAMYRGKSDTKGTVHYFDSSIEHAAVEKARLEQRIRLAIRDKRVRCAYQPKVDVRSGSIAGVEVLMRWIDEDGMIQPPGQFLNLAIELGLMDDLTHMIFAETVDSIDLINDAFGPDCTISVNVAARQAGDMVFMSSLVEALNETGFADRFMLELTEEAFISKTAFQQRILPMIRETGARISIDDFGVGYSSLSALADITADEVKVDRAFITELHKRPRSQSILRTIEALGQSLGMSVVVEGVETFEELAYLQAATRIKYAQGHYFSKPVMLDDLREGWRQERDLRPVAPARGNHVGRGERLARSA